MGPKRLSSDLPHCIQERIYSIPILDGSQENVLNTGFFNPKAGFLFRLSL